MAVIQPMRDQRADGTTPWEASSFPMRSLRFNLSARFRPGFDFLARK